WRTAEALTASSRIKRWNCFATTALGPFASRMVSWTGGLEDFASPSGSKEWPAGSLRKHGRMKQISVDTLRQWLEDGRPVNVLDVRPSADRAEWSIPGSLHVDAYE